MTKNQSLISFLNSTGISVDERANSENTDLPILISVDGNKIFASLFDEKNVVLFAITAEFSQMELSEVFLLTNTALRFNSFKWGSPVQFCVDEYEQYLYSWCTISLENKNTESFFIAIDALTSTNNSIRKNADVTHNPHPTDEQEIAEEKQNV